MCICDSLNKFFTYCVCQACVLGGLSGPGVWGQVLALKPCPLPGLACSEVSGLSPHPCGKSPLLKLQLTFPALSQEEGSEEQVLTAGTPGFLLVFQTQVLSQIQGTKPGEAVFS